MTKITKTLTVIIALFLISSYQISAQSTSGISAIPPRLEITAQPGKTTSKEIKIRNESNVERILSTSVKDFIVTDDKGTPIQLDSNASQNNRWAASSWIQISETKFKLKAGETKSLILTVIVPDNALPGGHYAMVLHSPKNETVLTQTGSAVETNVGTLVYVTVPGNIKQNAQVKDFSAPKFLEFGPVNFTSSISNLSDIHITPDGIIAITNWFGGNTANLALEKTNIFPNTSRIFTNTLDKKWLFGRYKAQIQAGYGTAGGSLASTVFFWIIPWRLIILILVFVALIIALIILNKNKPRRQSVETVEDLEKELEDLKNKYKDNK